MNGKKELAPAVKNIALLFIGIIFIVVIDQAAKVWAVNTLSDGPVILIKGVLELRYLENHGAAFGIFQGAQTFFLIVTAVFLIAAAFIYVRIPSGRKMAPLRFCLILMCGGAVGNLIDRVSLHYVRDFIYFSLIDFPIFNVADICVSVSAVILALLVLFKYKDEDLAFLKLRNGTDKTTDE